MLDQATTQVKNQAMLATIAEQTAFLVEKQNEVKATCGKAFEELSATVSEKLAQVGPSTKESDAQALRNISEHLAKAREEYEESINSDIAYLEAQLTLLNEVQTKGTPEECAELAAMIMEDGDVLETKKFKEDVAQEANGTMEGFLAVIADIRLALTENRFEELVAYMQSMLEDEEDEGWLEEEEEEEAEGDTDEEGIAYEFQEDEDDDFEEEDEHSAHSEIVECCGGKMSGTAACVCTQACACEAN